MRVVVERFNEQGTLRLQLAGSICVITIDRPQRRNALTQEMWRTMDEWVHSLPAKTRFLVIRGAGEEFTAGSDIHEFGQLDVRGANAAFETMEQTIRSVENLRLPTIASVSGPAFGAGFMLALACDLRIGTDQAKFGMPVGKLGITLQSPFVRRLVEAIGPSRTKDLVYTARTLDADEAVRAGILNYLSAPDKMDSDTIGICRKLSRQSKASLLAVKAGVQAVLAERDGDGGDWVDPDDFREGVGAFTEKRPARF